MQSLWILGMSLCLLGSAEAAEQALAPFDEILKAARAQSLESKRAALQHDQAVAAEDAVSYDGWPRLGLSAALAKRRMENNGQTVEPPESQVYGAKLTYDVYDFGRTSAKREQATYAAKISSLSLEEVQSTLTWSVAKSYAATVAALRLLTIARENLEVSESKLTMTRSDFKRGLRPEIDLVAAEADAGTAKLNFEKMKTDVIVAAKQLAQLTGVSISPNALLAASMTLDKSPDAWEKLLASWKARPLSPAEARRAMELESLSAESTAVTATALPSLGLALTAEEERGGATPGRTYAGQLQLTWDLPWPGQFSARREQLVKKRETLETEEAIEKRNRANASALGLERFEAAKRLWSAIENQLKLKQRQSKLTRARYAAGKATALELSNSELELGNTRLERARIANALDSAVLDIAEARSIDDPGALFR